MKSTLLLLCFGLLQCTVSSNRLRVFSAGNKTDYDSAVKNCTETNQSIVTLYDDQDGTFIKRTFSNRSGVWVGLHKDRNMTWSDDTTYKYNQTTVTLTWKQQICEAIHNNTWTGFNCTDEKFFMCHRGDNYTLDVKVKRNWCRALEYCRRHNMNLVSISSTEQNEKVIEKGNNQSFWIGLLHDEWKWEDNTCSLYRNYSRPTCTGKCTLYSIGTPGLQCTRCDVKQDYLCSKGFVRIIYIKEEKTWEEAFTYCKEQHNGLLWINDDSDQTAVKQWLDSIEELQNKPDEKIWIGLRQSRIFGFWIWTSDITVDHNNWEGGKQPQLPLSNHCGAINNNENYTWSDEECLFPHPFLCEEKIIYM